ncbi:HD domain-containing protein [Geomonas sp. Red32]|uniref:HD domain-containing protein n=1 Tax=Geomonas sp. Red32 TaxID=2912856 RepID=UPI00202CCA58|nr:HD domain-containing protein [Geomonas sp. Red32]MCM0084508.1 HD domain-containing protein [Geomonas sp. Red32]
MPEELPVPDLASLAKWFDTFCASYRSDDGAAQRNYDLKALHTLKVREGARLITSEGDPHRQLLAEAAALCHDLGRFPQYREYRTFKDSESLNHAHLSARIAGEAGVLDFLSKPERESVLTAVRLHNVYQIPAGLSPEAEDLLRVVRDADKLDIWRVFIEYFYAPEGDRASAATLGFPDLPLCSPEVLGDLSRGKLVRLATVKTVNDFKLLQLSWLYDINFRSTLALISERGLLDELASTLPPFDAVQQAVADVQGHLKRRLSLP